jgi:aminoglycoside phosphotransferase (APT) family kinase protein
MSGEYGRQARDIAAAVLGLDPGPLSAAESDSHHVFVGPDVVVKLIDAGRHSRLDREIALAPHLPAGLAAPLLASGHWPPGTRDVRYACYDRMPGETPGMGMPGVDGATARLLAEQATQQLGELHRWMPVGQAEQTLREPPDEGGFVGRAALLAAIDNLAAVDRGGLVSARLLCGLRATAERAPLSERTAMPVHADCHWGNWLARDQRVTALLDFEWARFGEPADDWFFLIRFSGRHREAVLDVVARATTTSQETLRAECEVREASYLVSDIRVGLERPGAPSPPTADRLHALEELIVGRSWWCHVG